MLCTSVPVYDKKSVGFIFHFSRAHLPSQEIRGASCKYEPVDLSVAHWISSKNKETLKAFAEANSRRIFVDVKGNYVFASDSEWAMNRVKEKNPGIDFHETSEMQG